MLLKAAILYRGGLIRENEDANTIGFDACVRRGLSDGNIKFLTETQALELRTINSLRDAAQHHLLTISEEQLYIHAQSGVSLFRELLSDVFQKDVAQHLPRRVLPISTTPPTDIATIFESQVNEILQLLKPTEPITVEVEARLKPLAILDSTFRGEQGQPSAEYLNQVAHHLLNKRSWSDIFSGAALIQVSASGSGPELSVRISKREGPPVHFVPEGTLGAQPVAVKRVNELDFYNMGAQQLAAKLNLTQPKTIAIVEYLNMRNDLDCYKEVTIGKSVHKRYSQRAIHRITELLKTESADGIWAKRMSNTISF